MPGVAQTSPDELLRDVVRAATVGVGGMILFGIPDTKDATGSEAWAEDGAVQRAVRLVKREIPGIVVITDVCMCEYTEHGHCGILENGEVDNDATLELLARVSVSHAGAGADMIAPSDMMDGRVAAIRSALDADGFSHTPILSYAAKYASAYYGPFREAAESSPKSGDRKGYQMDPGNASEALREVFADIEEGADAVMVKPAGPYLDVISRVKDATGYPVAAYQVSGEYAMIKAAAERGFHPHLLRHRCGAASQIDSGESVTPPVVAGINGMPRLELTHDLGSSAQIYLNGAQVTSWIPVGWHDMLYLSRLASFAPGEPIRGGIPVVFPQFAESGPLPKHGWLQTAEWQVAGSGAGEAEDSTHATLFTEDSEASRKIWPHRYRAELDVTLAESALTIALSIFNTSPESFSFTSALHNYFFVADVRESHIEGLRGTQYLDKTEGFIEKTATADKVVIDRETDRIYRNVREQVMLHDHASGTALDIAATGFPDIVVWNPWEQGARKFADMPEDDYLRMVCIEAALAATQFTLASGERWTGAQQLIVRGT